MTVIHLRRTTKKDSCCELFIQSVRNCESNSDNAAYKLLSWRRFLSLRHNTINWRSNQCCWQPDRKCINYLSDKMLARYTVEFITTLPSSNCTSWQTCSSAWLDSSKCHAATIWVTRCLRNCCYWKQTTVYFRTEGFYWHYYVFLLNDTYLTVYLWRNLYARLFLLLCLHFCLILCNL